MNVLQWLISGGGKAAIQHSASVPFQILGFEDILEIQKQLGQGSGSGSGSYIMINTMSLTDQEILICRTTSAKDEESILNELLDAYHTDKVRIVIYGRNSGDVSVFVKYDQIKKLGFTNVSIYLGGLFEWLLLQDIYGADTFQTTVKCSDMLKFCHKRMI